MKLDERMKTYEYVTRDYLTRRTPVIIRIDGKAFHSFTKGMQKPFDSVIMASMISTAEKLCENIQGCVLAYVQSDEISLLLTDYDTLETDPWFANNIQKIVSVSASMATLYFNCAFNEYIWLKVLDVENNPDVYFRKSFTALFDARVFNIPKEEVCNYFIWRQQDATRNSISSVGQSYFSNKKLHKKSSKEVQEMLFQSYGVNWSTMYSTSEKRGTCVVKNMGKWEVDYNIPVFTQERDYVEKLV